MLELDVSNPEDIDRRRAARAGAARRVVHAIAFAPEDALGGRFLTTPAQSATAGFGVGVLAEGDRGGLLPLMRDGGRIVALDFDTRHRVAVLRLDGGRQGGAPARSRYLARDLGPDGIRVNLVSAGPLGTIAARGIPGFERLAELWRSQAPLGWDVADPVPVADAVCFLLSDHARAISGEILHVDGGFHAVGAPLDP